MISLPRVLYNAVFLLCDIELLLIVLLMLNVLQIGKTRMKIPIRPVQCTHLQCFDAELFLLMNEKKPMWKCAVCDNAAHYSQLVIDT